VTFGVSGLIRGVTFGVSGLIRGGLLYYINISLHCLCRLNPEIFITKTKK
jgi:hypothetical protein